MSVENNSNVPSRFTLRKEYFGGFVHDARTTGYEVLNPTEYGFVIDLAKAEKVVFDTVLGNNPELASRVQTFANFGFLDIDPEQGVTLTNVRVIPPAPKIYEGVLTAPIRVYDTYTKRCNFECQHCYAASNPKVEEERRTVEQTAGIMKKFWEAGAMEWRFTGGEPTVYPDLFDSMAAAKDLGMNVSLNTNGWWSQRTAERIFEAGIREMVISLEGRAPVNDQRRKRGSFDHIVEVFGMIKDHNIAHPDEAISVVVNTAIGQDNVGDAEFVARLAASYGYNLTFLPVKPSGRARDLCQNEMLSPREWMEFSEQVQSLREDPDIASSGIKISHNYKDLFCPTAPDRSDKPYPFNYAECGALTTAISMLPDGRVFACPFILEFDNGGDFIGPNMITSSVEEAWNHTNMDTFRRAEKTQGCNDCTYLSKQCRGACKATVLGFGGEIKDGKLIGDDPYCYVSMMGEAAPPPMDVGIKKNRKLIPVTAV